MKAILDFEKFNVEDNTTFYRYNIDGNFVWFNQHHDGEIYYAYVKLKSPYCDYADMYIDTEEYFYPVRARISIKNRMLEHLEDVDVYIEVLEYLKELYDAVLEIFDTEGIHYKLHKAGEAEDEQN